MNDSTEAETYFAKFKNMLGHIGDAGLVGSGFDAAVRLEVRDEDGQRSFRFTQNLGEIRSRIQLDEASCRSLWPDKDLEEASLAMFSIHVEEAIDTANEYANRLELVSSGVVAL